MSSRCALRIAEQEKAGPPAFTALLGLSRGCGGLGRASLRSLACICVACAPLRSLAYMGRVRRTASPALRAYMPRAHINAPPCCVKRVHERHESPFFGQILTLVHTFWVRRCVGSNLSLVAEKSPSRVTGTGYERLWRRERDSNPRDAHAPNGFQDRRIQPLCHLSVVGNDSIEYRPA